MRQQKLGAWGEKVALHHLRSKGYKILAQNWRSPEGELDLIAQDGEIIVFVEVKTRSTHEYGWPEESITLSKSRRLQLAALAYLDRHELHDVMWRIDVIAIDQASSGAVERLEHYIDAIDALGDLL